MPVLNQTTRYGQRTEVWTPAPTPGLFDGAAVAFSLRKLRDAYAGSAVRIRRSSDNAEQDFGFSGNDFDSAGAATFIGGGSGFIVTWYDQSGNGRDVTQATAGSQPTYNASSLAGKPTLGTFGKSLDRTIDFGTVTNGTVFTVMYQAGVEPNNCLFDYGSGKLRSYPTFSDVIYFDFGSSGGAGRVNFSEPSGWNSNPHILELYRDSGDIEGITVDGSSLGSASRTDDITGSNTFHFFSEIGNTTPHNGFCSEFVFWTTDLGSSGRTAVRTDINAYYSIF